MYVQREPIGGLGENRIWSILTVESAAGAGGGALVMYALAQAFHLTGEGFGPGFFLQFVLISVGAALGVALTIRFGNSLSFLDRILLFIGFHMLQARGQHRVEPPIEASIWALTNDTDDLLPLLDEDMLVALNEGLAHGRA